MDSVWLGLRLLLLIGLANTAPLVAKRLLGPRWATPLDGGLLFLDGRPLLGRSKTVRGVVVATVASAMAAPALGLPVAVGVWVGLGAMLGDALSSFIKRRLGRAPSSRATGLDQIPEALLPLLLLQDRLGLGWPLTLGVTAAFSLLEWPLAWLSHRWGLRDQPY